MTRVFTTLVVVIAAGAAWTLIHAQAGTGSAPVNKMRAGVGYYTDAQAARGKPRFEKECSDCHTVDPRKPPRVSYGGSLVSGFRAIAEKRYNERSLYPSVYYYWRRMESEPGDNVDRVSQKDKLDITAYLLQQNGFPPGPKELVADLNAMKGMYLDPGPGFEHLFNGRDLSGWGFMAGHNCEPEPKGCGKNGPGTEFSVKNGEMVAAGKQHTLVYTERMFKNYTLQFEQRFVREWDDNPDLFNANAGLIVFMSNIRHWPDKYALVDGRWYDFMHIQSPGLAWKNTYDDEARRRALRPPNAWQDIEIVAKNGGLKAYLNGVLISTIEEGQMTEPTRLGFQSQVIETHWRHLQIKVED